MDHRNANITKVVRACVLGPNAVAEYVQLNETAPKLQNESPTVLRNAENYGAVLFRAGRFEEALQQFVKSCERGVKPIQMNLSWYMRAMTHKQLEQESEAIAWLEKADAAADALFALGHQVDWRDRSEVKIFSERSSRAHSRYQSKNAKRYD